MKRLTAIGENGNVFYPYCFREDTCFGAGESEKCTECDFAKKVCETLAAYENTGLAPSQILEMKERDTANAPVPAPLGMDEMVCPTCGCKTVPWEKYCSECGQKFWEERHNGKEK